MSDCIFCRILAGELPASFVYRDAVCAAFMDIQPVNRGHLLVVPVRHGAYLADIDTETAAHLDGLWTAESARGRGLGSRLLLAAEAAAMARGCRGAWLGTFDFQARNFYERHGYRIFGELRDFPEGHSHYELWKPLTKI